MEKYRNLLVAEGESVFNHLSTVIKWYF